MEDKIIGGIRRKNTGDSPEEIAGCLACPWPECVNCIDWKRRKAGMLRRIEAELAGATV